MPKIVDIRNLSFSYDNKKIFDKLNLKFEQGKWYNLVGPNGSGKTTIAKLITNTYPYDGTIEMNITDEDINVVYSINELKFSDRKVIEEINSYNDILKDKLLTSFGLNKYLEYKTCNLSGSNKILLKLLVAILNKPKLLILDASFDELDNNQKQHVIKVIKSLCKKGMTIINITNDMENTLDGDEIILLCDGTIKVIANKEEFYRNEKIIKDCGLGLPFIVDLSIKLKYYQIVDKIYFNMEELVDAVWK